jgi:hypothetical protein
MASIERRTRGGQTRWCARHRDPSGEQLVKVFPRKVDAERSLTSWLGHSSPEITWRGYSYLMPNDEHVGRAAMANNMTKIIPDGYRVCTETAPSGL